MFLKASMIQVSNEYTLPKQLISLRNIHDKLINKVNICFPGGLVVKNLLTNERRRCGFDPWVGKIPWRRKRLPTPVFWPGEFYRQRRLAGYGRWDCKESDMTERLFHFHE